MCEIRYYEKNTKNAQTECVQRTFDLAIWCLANNMNETQRDKLRSALVFSVLIYAFGEKAVQRKKDHIKSIFSPTAKEYIL